MHTYIHTYIHTHIYNRKFISFINSITLLEKSRLTILLAINTKCISQVKESYNYLNKHAMFSVLCFAVHDAAEK